jgi:hypothetical protein
LKDLSSGGHRNCLTSSVSPSSRESFATTYIAGAAEGVMTRAATTTRDNSLKRDTFVICLILFFPFQNSLKVILWEVSWRIGKWLTLQRFWSWHQFGTCLSTPIVDLIQKELCSAFGTIFRFTLRVPLETLPVYIVCVIKYQCYFAPISENVKSQWGHFWEGILTIVILLAFPKQMLFALQYEYLQYVESHVAGQVMTKVRKSDSGIYNNKAVQGNSK